MLAGPDWPPDLTFLHEFPDDERKFELPFFIVYEDCVPGPAPMIERQKEWETRDLEQARTLVIVNFDKEKVGEYAEEGLGGVVDQALGKRGVGALRLTYTFRMIDMKNSWRNRRASATYELPTRIGAGSEKSDQRWSAIGFKLDMQQGTLVDQVLRSSGGRREEPDFNPPGSIAPSLIYLRQKREDYRRNTASMTYT